MFLLIGACKSTGKVQKGNESRTNSKEELLIYIQQSPCRGKCPDYEARFYTGKKMIYEGRSHMPLIGKYEFLVPEELTKSLIFEAVKMNVKLVPDSVAIPQDVAVTRVWVVINGKMKKMVGWTGSGNETFKNYVKLLQTEVKTMITDQEGIKMP
jgi:hypothetical protein